LLTEQMAKSELCKSLCLRCKDSTVSTERITPTSAEQEAQSKLHESLCLAEHIAQSQL